MKNTEDEKFYKELARQAVLLKLGICLAIVGEAIILVLTPVLCICIGSALFVAATAIMMNALIKKERELDAYYINFFNLWFKEK